LVEGWQGRIRGFNLTAIYQVSESTMPQSDRYVETKRMIRRRTHTRIIFEADDKWKCIETSIIKEMYTSILLNDYKIVTVQLLRYLPTEEQ